MKENDEKNLIWYTLMLKGEPLQLPSDTPRAERVDKQKEYARSLYDNARKRLAKHPEIKLVDDSFVWIVYMMEANSTKEDFEKLFGVTVSYNPKGAMLDAKPKIPTELSDIIEDIRLVEDHSIV